MAANKTTILISARDQASKAFGRVAKNSTKAQKRVFGVNSALKATDKSMGSLAMSLKGLAGGLAAGLGVGTLAGVVKDAISVKIEFDKIHNVLKAVTGSSEKAGEEFSFLSSEANRLGIELRPLAQSYTRLSAAGRLLGLTTDDTREIFTSFSEALTGFGATREQSVRVFTAIEQILSKGKVSAEELRQQLGEALPGSFQLAAKAAGVTVQELDGMLKRGELLSSEFILPFAKAVRNEFGGAAVEGAKLLNAEFSRTINVLDKVKLAFAEGGEKGRSLSDAIANILVKTREFLSDEDRLKRIGEWGQTLGEGLQIAASAMASIAKTLNAIPIAALVAAGALAIGGKRGGYSSGAVQAVKSSSDLVPQRKSLQYTRLDHDGGISNVNTAKKIPTIRQGGINDSNLRSVQGVLGARAGFSSSEVLKRERRALQSKQFSRPKSRKAQLGPDSLVNVSQSLSGQFGQDKIAKAFEGSMVGAVEKVRKPLKAKIASVFKSGVSKLGGALGGVATSMTSLINPVNALIVGGTLLAEKWTELKLEQQKLAVTNEKIKKTSEATAPKIAALRAFDKGAENPFEELAKVAESNGIKVTRAMVEAADTEFRQMEETESELIRRVGNIGKEISKAIQKVIDPTKKVVSDFAGKTEDIKAFEVNVNKLGLARAEEIKKVKEHTAALERQDVVKKEAIKLAEERTHAERLANATSAARDFDKETDKIKKNNELRKQGMSEERIALRNRFDGYVDMLKKQGLGEEAAKKRAGERINAEIAKEPIKIERKSSAVGTATKARSIDAALKKQQRQEDKKFETLKTLAEKTSNSTESIAELLSQYNASFN